MKQDKNTPIYPAAMSPAEKTRRRIARLKQAAQAVALVAITEAFFIYLFLS